MALVYFQCRCCGFNSASKMKMQEHYLSEHVKRVTVFDASEAPLE